MSYGRSGSLWSRSRDWARGLLRGTDVPATIVADPGRTNQGLLALTDVVAHPAANASIDFSGDAPVVVPEVPGIGYDYGLTRAMVMQRVGYRDSTPVQIATTVVQPDVTQQTLSATLPTAESALSSALVMHGIEGQSWSIDAAQLKSIVSVKPDGTAVQVDRAALKRLVKNIAAGINQDATDSVLFVNGVFIYME
jgi:hypothetical protein